MYDENPWSPEEQASYRKPKRVWVGLTPKETELVTRGAVDRACCPDCWRWHLDSTRNTPEGHCWSCYLEIKEPGSTDQAWAKYVEIYLPKPKEAETKAGLKLLGSVQKAGAR